MVTTKLIKKKEQIKQSTKVISEQRHKSRWDPKVWNTKKYRDNGDVFDHDSSLT